MPLVYVNFETPPHIACYSVEEEGEITLKARWTLPEGAMPADMVLKSDGAWLYMALRGPEALGALRLDEAGLPTGFEALSLQSANPRAVVLDPDEKHLLVSTVLGGRIQVCPLDANGKPLSPAAEVAVPKAGALAFY